MDFGKPASIKNDEESSVLRKKIRDNFDMSWDLLQKTYDELSSGTNGTEALTSDIKHVVARVTEAEELAIMMGIQ